MIIDIIFSLLFGDCDITLYGVSTYLDIETCKKGTIFYTIKFMTAPVAKAQTYHT